MAEYLSPGVYVEEVPSVPPIVGVGTSTAAFIGVVDASKTTDPEYGYIPEGYVPPEGTPPTSIPFTMPLDPKNPPGQLTLVNEGIPTLVTNWQQFKNKFGDVQEGNKTLAHAVYGFFNNGGTTCYVSRVTAMDAPNVNLDTVLKKCEAIDEIAIVAVPGEINSVMQVKLIDHCETMKDRFAILDGQHTTNITQLSIQGGVRNSKYAAMYFPWLKVYDPITKDNAYLVPPSGHIAGIYARVDQERGVHKAPANEVVRGALGLEYDVNKIQQQEPNKQGINIIRNLNGNIRVWGARTLGGLNGEYTYINVRRLMNFIEESIDEGTQFVVFEPNNKALWQRIIRSVRAFLTTVWRDGALFGDTPEQAFYVKCDESTNPREIRELGQVVTEIGVAIVKPAEFVIFRISQITLPSA